MTTKQEIREWLESANEWCEGATHVLIVCDEFSYEDFPVYLDGNFNVQDEVDYWDNNDLTHVVEVYNLALDIDEQLKATKAWNL